MVDDGSHDGMEPTVEQFKHEKSRCSEKKGGHASARDPGAEVTRGLIGFLDGDNCCPEEKLQREHARIADQIFPE